MSELDLSAIYRSYLDCLNQRGWASLGQFVDDDVSHNGRPIGLSGYRAMLEQDVRDIPDLRFDIELLVTEPPVVASRLAIRLYAQAHVPRIAYRRQANRLRRKRVLCVSRREDRSGLVGDRQDRYRGAIIIGTI